MAKSQFVPYQIFKKNNDTTDENLGLCSVLPNEIDVLNESRPKILLFPGNGSLSDDMVNGYLQYLYNNFSNKADIFGIRYSYDTSENLGYLTEKELAYITQSFFQPLYLNKDNTPKPVDLICKNMRKIVFVSHCAGETIVNALLNNMAKDMKNAGMQQPDIKKALSFALHVSYAPYLNNETKFGTNIYFMSLNDKMIADKFFNKLSLNKQAPPYLGAAKIFDFENGFGVVSNSFGNIFHDDAFDDHRFSTILLDENGSSLMHKHSSRTLSIINSFLSVLAFGVSGKIVSKDDYKLIVESEIEKQQNTNFEKMQESEFYSQAKGGQPLLDYMKKHNIPVSDVIDGKIKFKDIVKPVATTPWGVKIYPKINYKSAGINERYKYPLLKMVESEKILQNNRTSKEDSNLILHKINYVVLKNGVGRGCVGENKPDDIYAQAKIGGNNLDDCVQVDVQFSNIEKPELNKLDVKLGKKFVDREYADFFDLKQSEIASGKKGLELSEQQTRVVLNLSNRFWVPIGKIRLEDGIRLNKKVVEKEIMLDEQKIAIPALNKKDLCKNVEKLA